MKILLEIPDLYAEAYRILAKDLGRGSRQELILEILVYQMNKYPAALLKAKPEVAVKRAMKARKAALGVEFELNQKFSEQDYRDVLGDDFDLYKDHLEFRDDSANIGKTPLDELEELDNVMGNPRLDVLDEILNEMGDLTPPELPEL